MTAVVLQVLLLSVSLFMPRHKMAEGHIEFTLSVCVFVRLCVFAFVHLCVPESCPALIFILHGRI